MSIDLSDFERGKGRGNGLTDLCRFLRGLRIAAVRDAFELAGG